TMAAGEEAPNPTLAAIVGTLDGATTNWTVVQQVPFSSARQWSAVQTANRGSWVLGGADVLLPVLTADAARLLSTRIDDHAAQGRRVLLLARSEDALPGEGG